MDTWSEKEVKAMRVGGNQAMIDFFARHNISKDASVSVKYKTETASLYREMYSLFFRFIIVLLLKLRVLPFLKTLPSLKTKPMQILC